MRATTAALLCLLASGGASAQYASPLPTSVSLAGLLDLSSRGEVILLPQHDASPFNTVVATRSKHPCSVIEKTLLDVESYPKLWPGMTDVRVLSRTPKRIEYEFEVDVVFNPTIKGLIELPSPGVLLFHDTETGGRSWYQLRDAPGGCQILYNLHQPRGKHSSFVDLLTSVEKNAVDSGEILGVLATVRGVAKPEREVRRARPVTVAARDAWEELAGRGTVIRTLRRPTGGAAFAARRRIDRPVHQVLHSLRSRETWSDQVDIVKACRDRGRTADWTFGYFGGRVNVTTTITEEGRADSLEGLRITERIVGGDISRGYWRWTVREVQGGTDVELYYEADLARGSMVLRNFVRQNDNLADVMPMQLVLELMGTVVGGRSLPASRDLARR